MQRAKAAAIEQAEFKAQMDITRSQIEATSAELGRATDRVERTKKLVEAGQASTTDLQNAESMLTTARSIRDQAEAHKRALDERAAIMQARVQAGGDTVATGEVRVMVTYDYQDLQPFESDIAGLAWAVVSLGGAAERNDMSLTGGGSVKVRTTPAGHKVLVAALNAMRRARANEPKLPGLDADDLIRKSQSR
jgi:hypothetical protein